MITASLSAQDSVQRRALLIGVSEYEKAGFTSLKYPEADVKGIEAELKKAGFKTTLMLSSLGKNDPLRATKSNIERQLQTPEEYLQQKQSDSNLKPGFIAGLADLKKSDLVLVVLAGHGRQELIANPATKRKEATPFFCPTDANRSFSNTWVSINKLMKNVSEYSGSEKNLILIDACRDNRSRGRGIDGKSVAINVDNLAICFSSSAGTESYESDKLKHGIFSHFVIEGLKGKAVNFRKQVTWGALTEYVQAMVIEQAPILIERKQTPHIAGSLKATPVLIPKIENSSIAAAKTKPEITPANDKAKIKKDSIANAEKSNSKEMDGGKGLFGSFLNGFNSSANEKKDEGIMQTAFLAVLMYESEKQNFPFPKDFKLANLSWRVSVLPFLKQSKLFDRFDKDADWASEKNKPFVERMPAALKFSTGGIISFVMPKKVPKNWLDLLDGSANTIALVEDRRAESKQWTKPGGVTPEQFAASVAALKDGDTLLVAFYDGSIKRLSNKTSKETVIAYCTPNGGESHDFEALK